jgi:hypothetical protein
MPASQREIAPALQAVLLDEMHELADTWDLMPRLYFLYPDRIARMELPDQVWRDRHPRRVLHLLAEGSSDDNLLPEGVTRPRDLMGTALMIEAWSLTSRKRGDLDSLKGVSFATLPDAIEARMLVASVPGYAPVAAVHQRDSKNTGQTLDHPEPEILRNPMSQGNATPDMINNLMRIARNLNRPPATFTARSTP